MGVAAALGGEVAWHVEFDDAPSRILAHHWPDVPNYGDVTTTDFATVPPVDVLTGGFPCQDVSLAGRRRGLKEGTRSGLWSHFARAIDQLHPQLVVIENVRGLLSAEATGSLEFNPWAVGDGDARPTLRALGAVLGDLADLGYDAEWCGLRAADAGAPHGRFRVFAVAYPRSSGGRGWAAGPEQAGSHDAALRPGAGRAVAGQPATAEWGGFAPAITRWEELTRPAPAPSRGDGRDGAHRLSPDFVEWMMGLPMGHVTDPAIGISRSTQLKALGNGVVPQQAELAVRTLLGRVA
jgi:DNA (cytosine-5)-methyltransferase 1